MLQRIATLLFGAIAAQGILLAQYGIGIQGGPLFFQGVWEAKQALTNTRGWMAGIQVVEGRKGETGFRIGVDYGERSYHLRARNINRKEEYDITSSLIWLSTEIRWPLSRRFGLFFDLGPVIGFELKEMRSGVDFFEEALPGEADSTLVTGLVERGFAIRDGHWRIGLSTELPIADRLRLTLGAHVCPGVGSWARGHGYATWDTNLRAGVLFRLRSTKRA